MVQIGNRGQTGAAPTRGRPPRRGALRIVALLAGALGVGVAAISACLAYRLSRPRRSYGEGAPIAGSYQQVTFPAADGLQLSGWFLPGVDAGLPVVLCHGFHTGRREMLPLALGLRDRGHHVLTFDFRAHGESRGRRTSCGPLERWDLEGAVEYLLARPEVKGDRAGVVGFSMGGAIAILTAARVSAIGAVVADSAFATMKAVVPSYLRAVVPLPSFPFAALALWFGERIVGVKADQVRPVDVVDRLAPRPILLIHGTADRIVPPGEALLLHQSAGEPRELWMVPGADHVGARFLDFEGYLDRVEGFLRRYLSPATGSARPEPRSGDTPRS